MDDTDDRVVLMTIHSAKGLEFNNVFIVGMEEGVFPGYQTIYDGPAAIEEERRLAYVAITRARKNLTITNTTTRMLFGSTTRNAPSRFLKEVPEEYCNVIRPAGGFGYGTSIYSENQRSSGYSYSQKSNFAVAASTKPKFKDTNVYKAGMNVSHATFGEGVVLSVSAMGDDSLLEVNFAKVGRKKLMANYAKLKII